MAHAFEKIGDRFNAHPTKSMTLNTVFSRWCVSSIYISFEDFDKLTNPGSSLLAETVKKWISTLKSTTFQIPKLQKHRSHNEISQKIIWVLSMTPPDCFKYNLLWLNLFCQVSLRTFHTLFWFQSLRSSRCNGVQTEDHHMDEETGDSYD